MKNVTSLEKIAKITVLTLSILSHIMKERLFAPMHTAKQPYRLT